MASPDAGHPPAANSATRILFASMAGTAIEYFDFYIYGTAAVLVFPQLFFPASSPAVGRLQSLATFALAFFARPLGAAFFGHFGDRIGRKATLVASLLTMGLSTIAVGLLPTYAALGFLAPLLLCLCRVGQGFGLGGEWGGAVLLATENAPPGKRAWFGMFPQLGAPAGFFLSGIVFLGLSEWLTDAQFRSFGWRLPFIASSLLVAIGLYVRLQIEETPVFRKVLAEQKRESVPVVALLRDHWREVIVGTFVGFGLFVLFYLLTIFCLSWGTTKLGFTREHFLLLQIGGVVFFALGIPLSAALADRWSRRGTMAWAYVGIVAFGLALGPLFSAGQAGAIAALVLGFLVMGLSYAPLSTLLAETFPSAVRYSGASLAFNLTGIVGGSVAPAIATKLAQRYGLEAVGYYLAAAALVSLAALALGRQKHAATFLST
ncbi:MAG TPA: MFS transporter [Opitutaceae bacterium]|jgi:metabolite-proton symporter|nr:MFS transporter [Opitutaceae bacterium]